MAPWCRSFGDTSGIQLNLYQTNSNLNLNLCLCIAALVLGYWKHRLQIQFQLFVASCFGCSVSVTRATAWRQSVLVLWRRRGTSWSFFPRGHSFRNEYRCFRMDSTFVLTKLELSCAAATHSGQNSSQTSVQRRSLDLTATGTPLLARSVHIPLSFGRNSPYRAICVFLVCDNPRMLLLA